MKISPHNQQFYLLSVVSLMKNGGNGFSRALSIMAEGGMGVQSVIAKKMLMRYEDNGDVYEAFEGFKENIRVAAAAADEKGVMVAGLESCIASLDVVSEGTTKLKVVMFMPTILMVILIGMMVQVGVNMIPSFAGQLPISMWPIGTKVVYYCGNFINDYLVQIVVVLLASRVAYVYSLKRWPYSASRHTLEKIWPGYELYRLLESQAFMEMLSMLMNVGESLSKSLVLIKKRATPYIRSHIEQMELMIGDEKGAVVAALDTGLITSDDVGMIFNISNEGTDIAKALNVIVEKGRKEIRVKLEQFGFKVMIAAGVLIVSTMAAIMFSIMPLIMTMMASSGL